MLCLTRKKNEQIVLQTSDGDITITFAGFRGSEKASIGIDAPESVAIVRAELLSQSQPNPLSMTVAAPIPE